MNDQIERELLLPTSPEKLWNVITGDGWLASEVRLDLVPGGEASFSCEEWSKQGWVEEAVAPCAANGSVGRLTFWWGLDGEPASRVALTLEPAGEEETRLRLVEARPLELLDVVGIPHCGGAQHGPLMLALA